MQLFIKNINIAVVFDVHFYLLDVYQNIHANSRRKISRLLRLYYTHV